MTTTFSGAQLRERDKAIEERHKKELDSVERRLERFRKALDNAEKQAFELRNSGQQLAESLGFSDINEAQRAIDVSDHEVTFRETFERVQVLGDEIKVERTRKELLEIRCLELEESLENERKCRQIFEKSERRCQQELHDLQLQYDAIQLKGKRAQELFTRDRRKFFDLYRWLCMENADKSNLQVPDIDYDRIRDQNTLRRRDILREFGPALSDLLDLNIGEIEEKLKEAHEAIDEEYRQHCILLDAPAAQETSQDIVTGGPTKSQSPPERQPLVTILTNSTTTGVKTEPVETPTRKGVHKYLLPASSDTEDDSQAPSQSCFKTPLPPVSLDPAANSSDTEEDSQAPKFRTSSPDAPPITSPFSVMKTVEKRITNPSLPTRYVGPSASGLEVKSEPEDDNVFLDDRRPPKRPRLSLGSSIVTPQAAKSGISMSRRVFSTSRATKEKKAYLDENTPVTKVFPIGRLSGQTRLEDYTIYKKRGRYIQEGEPSTKTINALYAINPERNGGVSHQYEDVVRNKEARMRMDAGDCDECRDWYAAVGSMPPRDRGPLWRSPSTTPVKKRCKRHAEGSSSDIPTHESPSSPSDRRQAEIESHKKLISRHRQNWARARTPPGYWNIGFPDTQEVREINERAEEMHQRKLREVEKEAERGRWIRR
ncbi:hypothetical protein AN958_03370 [Leucoagaricus sp. SymC.cos]|nr:hypothetical protein AN958_03370 [Leucoagaricus sp. SymC.cos]